MEYKESFRVTDELLASQGQRLANFFIDMAMRFIILFVIGIVLALIGTLMDLPALIDWLQNVGTFEDYLISFFIIFVYYVIMEITLSRTIGKYITKTIVVMGDGSKPNDGTIIKRTLCRFIPFDPLSFAGDGRGWHDSISDTYVVRKEDFDEKMKLFYAFDEIGKQEHLN